MNPVPAPRRPRLAIFGTGPVGQALTRQFALLPFVVEAYDVRPQMADHATILSQAELVELAGCLEPGDFVLIASPTHELDYLLARAVLTSDRFRYCGMLGSRKKSEAFRVQLAHDGVNLDQLARFSCPLGIPGLGGRAPEVIAVSAAAELLALIQADEASISP